MANANTEVLDLTTTRAIDLQRLAATQARDAARFLKALESDIVARLAKMDPTGGGGTSRQAARLEKLLAQVKASIVSAYRNRIDAGPISGDYKRFTCAGRTSVGLAIKASW